jgi:hypothetical protein
MLVRLAVRNEDQLAVFQVLGDINHKGTKDATAMPHRALSQLAIGEPSCAEYV